MENIGRFKYLIICVILILVLVLAFIIYKLSLPKPENKPTPLTPIPTSSQNIKILPIVTKTIDEKEAAKGKFTPSQKVATVGKETIYGIDLDYILYDQYPGDFASSSSTPEVSKKKALLVAVNDSILLQEEEKEGKLQLTPDIFNNADKDQPLRAKKVQEITKRRTDSQEKISGGMISVWYHNVRLPKIPLSDAEKLAKDTITNVYNDIKSGKISFEDGGARIRDNKELINIDPSYQGNAYMVFKDRAINDLPFTYTKLNDILPSLKEGEISDIIKITSPEKAVSFDEEFYAFIKVMKRTNTGKDSFYNWLDKIKKGYEIVLF